MVELVYLQSEERPPPDEEWLLIVKTHSQDYEVILCRGIEAITLSASPLLFEAQEQAITAARSLKFEIVYVLGEPNM